VEPILFVMLDAIKTLTAFCGRLTSGNRSIISVNPTIFSRPQPGGHSITGS
jgi:hypothetical protein